MIEIYFKYNKFVILKFNLNKFAIKKICNFKIAQYGRGKKFWKPGWSEALHTYICILLHTYYYYNIYMHSTVHKNSILYILRSVTITHQSGQADLSTYQEPRSVQAMFPPETAKPDNLKAASRNPFLCHSRGL